jgi:hypothetical protein
VFGGASVVVVLLVCVVLEGIVVEDAGDDSGNKGNNQSVWYLTYIIDSFTLIISKWDWTAWRHWANYGTPYQSMIWCKTQQYTCCTMNWKINKRLLRT